MKKSREVIGVQWEAMEGQWKVMGGYQWEVMRGYQWEVMRGYEL